MAPSKFFSALALVVALASGAATQTSQWHQIKKPPIPDSQLHISGMAFLTEDDKSVSFIVVHDAKDGVSRDPQPRAGILILAKPIATKDPKDKPPSVAKDAQPDYQPLTWKGRDGTYPYDLEAIDAVPGSSPKTFVAMTSEGNCYHIRVNGTVAEVIWAFELKSKFAKYDYEGFALQKSAGGELFAFWAHRGWTKNYGEVPAKLFWATLDLSTYTFGDSKEREMEEVPFPKPPCVRHISDIKVDADFKVFTSATRDCNKENETEFASAAYEIGQFVIKGNQASYVPLLTPKLRGSKTTPYKIEALEFMPRAMDRFIFGTDDEEKGGGSVFVQWPDLLPQASASPLK